MSGSGVQGGSTSTFNSGDAKVRKTREGKPKSRNGCMTCKIRRVKCDETKPVCQRCVRFGQRCDGYITKTPSKDSLRVSTTRAIAPKGQSGSPSTSIRGISPKSPTSALSFFPSLTSNAFLTPHEQEAFHRFCERTSHQLSASTSPDSWTKLVLQACESSPSIRYAVLTTGDLNFTASASDFDVTSNEIGTLKHHFAFRQFQKSTCLLRRDFGGEYSDLRTTFVGCLLFYCFESVHPYQELAIKQAYSGLRLIRAWVSRFYSGNAPYHQKGPSRGGLAPHIMEEEIARSFGALELRIMAYAHEQEREAHAQYKLLGQSRIETMPEMFSSVHEARSFLELVVRRSMHWLRSTMQIQQFNSSSSSTPSSPKTNASFQPFNPNSNINDGPGNSPPCLFLTTNPEFSDKSSTLAEYSRWDAAFKPLLNYARSRASSEANFLRASMLRLHWLAGYLSICISGNHSREALVNSERFRIELTEMEGIASTLLKKMGRKDERNQEGKVDLEDEAVFEMQMIVPLVSIGWVYPHKVLRRLGIELLLRSPRKMDSWDGIVVGRAMAWLADIEEEGMSEGSGRSGKGDEFIPVERTASCINMTFDSERRLAVVSCLQAGSGNGNALGLGVGSISEAGVRRETTIPW